MKKIVELIELEEQHRKNVQSLKEQSAQKSQKELAEHKSAIAEIEKKLRDRDQIIEDSVKKHRSQIETDLQNTEGTKTKAMNAKEIENIILQYVK